LELPRSQLKGLVHTQGISRTDQLLLLLLADDTKPKLPKSLTAIGKDVGLRMAKWHISDMLRRTKGLAISVPGGWEVTAAGLDHLAARGLIGAVHIAQPATDLRALLPKITNQRTREFVEEAVVCYEAGAYRGSVVLSWIGSVSLLYEHVFHNKLAEFNAELASRASNPKQKPKPVVAIDDFTDIKEDSFLDMLQAISVIGKSVKDELKGSLQIGQNAAAAHLEVLIKNVFTKF